MLSIQIQLVLDVFAFFEPLLRQKQVTFIGPDGPVPSGFGPCALQRVGTRLIQGRFPDPLPDGERRPFRYDHPTMPTARPTRLNAFIRNYQFRSYAADRSSAYSWRSRVGRRLT